MTPDYAFGLARQASLRSAAAAPSAYRRSAPSSALAATLRRSAGEGLIRIGSWLVRGADVRVATPA